MGPWVLLNHQVASSCVAHNVFCLPQLALVTFFFQRRGVERLKKKKKKKTALWSKAHPVIMLTPLVMRAWTLVIRRGNITHASSQGPPHPQASHYRDYYCWKSVWESLGSWVPRLKSQMHCTWACRAFAAWQPWNFQKRGIVHSSFGQDIEPHLSHISVTVNPCHCD